MKYTPVLFSYSYNILLFIQKILFLARQQHVIFRLNVFRASFFIYFWHSLPKIFPRFFFGFEFDQVLAIGTHQSLYCRHFDTYAWWSLGVPSCLNTELRSLKSYRKKERRWNDPYLFLSTANC